MPELEPLVEVEDLVIKFRIRDLNRMRAITPVDRVTLSIFPGEVLSLVGESGSGKSTLGRALVRINEPAAGSIRVAGRDVTHVRGPIQLNRLRKDVQMVFQDPFGSLNPVRTIGQHLRVITRKHSGLRGDKLEQEILRLLETVGLNPAAEVVPKYPHELSGGQRQRVAIARALAVQPKFIVADEPISMLDVSIRADILRLLNHLKSEFHLAYLYITHDLASARYFGDRIMVLYGGQVMETGPSDDIVEHAEHPYTNLLLSATAGNQTTDSIGEISIEPPNLFEDRKGCPFAHRCPEASNVCREQQPTLVPREGNAKHFVACHHR